MPARGSRSSATAVTAVTAVIALAAVRADVVGGMCRSVGSDIEKVVAAAETNMEQMRTSYTKWRKSGGPEEDFVNTGDNDVARALGRARYSLDFVLLDEAASYAALRGEIAEQLEAGNRPDMAALVRA